MDAKDRARARAGFIACLKGEQPVYRAEERVVWPNGSVHWLESHMRGRHGRDGRAVELSGLVRDCTERKQQEAKYKAVFDTVDSAIAISRLSDSVHLEANDAWERFTGHSRRDAVGRAALDFGLWVELRDRIEVMRRLEAAGSISAFPTRFRHASGQVVDVLLSGSLIELEGERCVLWSWSDVSQLHRAETEARKSLERFSAVFDNVPDPISIVRLSDDRILAVNDTWVSLNGYPRERALGRTATEIGVWRNEDRDAAVAELREKGRMLNRLTTFVRPDGTRRQALVSAAIVELDGEPCTMWMGRDVTRLREAEEARAASERRYRTLFDEALESIVIVSPEGRVLDVNQVTLRQSGYSREQVIGQPFSGFIEAGSQQALAEIQGGKAVRVELRVRHSSGNAVPVEVRSGPLPDGNVLAFLRDLSERRRAEQMLANLAHGVSPDQDSSFFRTLVLQLCRELGADYALVGELVPPERASVRTLAFCVDGSEAPGFEYGLSGSPCETAVNQRGCVVYLAGVSASFPKDVALSRMRIEGYVGTSLINSRGDAIGIMTLMSRKPLARHRLWVSVLELFAARAAAEIERGHIEAALRELNASLERRVAERTAALESANRELESFSYSVSHDLRAPLRAIAGFSAILKEDCAPELSAPARGYFDRIERNAVQMGKLIDDLLEFSRTGRVAFERRPVDMHALAGEVLREIEVPQGMQVCFGELPVAQCDRAMMRQVWRNLIENAVKFSRHAASPRVEIGGATDGNTARYWVRDNGSGFDMRYVNRLFGVFQRLHRPADYEGTGVGLAIVQRIVLRHGGSVSAEGEEGRGATFGFSLPIF